MSTWQAAARFPVVPECLAPTDPSIAVQLAVALKLSPDHAETALRRALKVRVDSKENVTGDARDAAVLNGDLPVPENVAVTIEQRGGLDGNGLHGSGGQQR
jgi:hypothetical protein